MPRVWDLARTVRRGDSEPVHRGAFHVCSSEPLHGNALSTSNAGVRCEVSGEELVGIIQGFAVADVILVVGQTRQNLQ